MLHKSSSVLKFIQWGLLLIAALTLLKFLYLSSTISHASDDAADFIANRNKITQVTPTSNDSIKNTDNSNSLKTSSLKLGTVAAAGKPPKLSDNNDIAASDSKYARPTDGVQSELSKSSSGVIAVIKINSVNLLTPIYKGTNTKTLDIGAGLIEGTSTFDNPTGNVGIAAHRDSYFRALKDIRVGDEIKVATKDKNLIYLVKHLQIVDPSNTSVLYPDNTPKMTLVTCYPFDFVGKAPKRFIVTADLLTSTPIEIVPELTSS